MIYCRIIARSSTPRHTTTSPHHTAPHLISSSLYSTVHIPLYTPSRTLRFHYFLLQSYKPPFTLLHTSFTSFTLLPQFLLPPSFPSLSFSLMTRLLPPLLHPLPPPRLLHGTPPPILPHPPPFRPRDYAGRYIFMVSSHVGVLCMTNDSRT